jgi:hypothetical protein
MSTRQAGVLPQRLEWAVESVEGETPDNPEWELFSDVILSAWDWEPDANTQRQDAVGSATARGFFNGTETHEAAFEYHLQQWYEDGSGNPLDAGYYFLEPDSDNTLRATHTVVSRSEQSSGGADGAGRRIFTVGKGGHPDTLTAPFETDDGSPINQELTYQFEKIRQYAIDQPSSATTLDVANNGTFSVDVTIEDDGASTAETVTVSGGSTVTTTSSFGDIDAVELSTDTDGDVVVSDGGGTVYLTIKGSDSYPAGEGDLGVPALGTSNHASPLNSDFIRFLDDSLNIPNTESGLEIISGEMSVETGLEANARVGSARQDIYSTSFVYTVTATLAGTRVSVDQIENYLTEKRGAIEWLAQEGSITFNDVSIQSAGTYGQEAGNGKLQFDNEFEAETIIVE